MNAIIPVQTRLLERNTTQPLNQNPAVIYLLALQPTGRYSQRWALNLVARLLGISKMSNEAGKEITFLFCPWAALRYQHLEAIRSKLAESYKPGVVNRVLTAIRGVLRTARQLGQMTEGDYHQARVVKGVRKTTRLASRVLSTGEIAALVLACKKDPTPFGARDAAIIDMAFTAGLRRSELSRLDMADYNPATRKLTVRGKGGVERWLYLINGAARAMSIWLEIRGNQSGALFRPMKRGGQILPRRISSRAIYNLFMKRGKEAGVKDFSPDDLRRTFIQNLLEDGIDISTVAKLAGHTSVTMAKRYV